MKTHTLRQPQSGVARLRRFKTVPVTVLTAAASLVVLVGAAAAATAPSVTTGAVTAVATTTATINGTVNPNGITTTWIFQYGTTTSYGTKTSSVNDGSGTTDSNVSSSLTGLTPGTTYHYQLVATSSAGTTSGSDGTFNTLASAPTATTAAASSIGATTATLNGSINANAQVTTWYFEYGTTTGYGTKTPAQNAGSGTSAIAVSAAISGLQSGQTYHFRVVAQAGSTTTVGSDLTFKASSAPVVPSVTTSAATSLSATSVRLNGTVNPNGQATTWLFQYGPTTSYGSSTPTESAGSGTSALSLSATLVGISSGIIHFRLVATNATGTKLGSDLTFGTTPAPVVQTGSAQSPSATGVTLTGTVNPEGRSTTWYFEYGQSGAFGSKTAAKSAGSGTGTTGVSAAITGLAGGTNYYYRLVGTSGSGTTYGSTVGFSTLQVVTLSASTPQSVYGKATTLAGTVSTRGPGVSVTLLSEPYGSTAFTTIGSAVTGSGGTWSFQVKPRLQTTYQARVGDGTSTSTTVGVRPAVSLRLISKGRFATRVVASRSFIGKVVKLQRARSDGSWQTLARARLNDKSAATFAIARLPLGSSTIRIAMSVNQAGAGFLGGFSRTATYHRVA